MSISVRYNCRRNVQHPENLIGPVSWWMNFSDAEGVSGLITQCPVCGHETTEKHFGELPPSEVPKPKTTDTRPLIVTVHVPPGVGIQVLQGIEAWE